MADSAAVAVAVVVVVVIEQEPTIVTPRTTFVVRIGLDIFLPCVRDNSARGAKGDGMETAFG